MFAHNVFGLETDRHGIEHHVDRERHGEAPSRRGRARRRWAVAQLLCAGQVRVAPRRRLGLVTELLQRVGLEFTRCLIGRVGEYEMVDHFGNPPVITGVVRRLCMSE